ncbi:DUF1501 domain-containing protein [Aquabacterium sp. CECT 9606]|uniref:DUF1501 domain-containing protein n=1 Tax=Aquabacterium sp. CECT 9606 TaxID=2845822 RepID=UPI001E6478F9|nr:DUF1501 domain-containing protein [Aquabacterium sp. CECT 9606]CAH0350309.1 hypothetical protein AQB9606_01511 [Aquabacterium sp. CECT 9606]
MSRHDSSRRAFLRRTGALSMMGAAAPWAASLATMAEAAAATSGNDDYKALVCVFLNGGNDHGNTVIPCDASSYLAYANARQNLARTEAELVNTKLNPSSGLPSGREVAFPPEWAPLKRLFEQQRLGMLLNIGPLLQPTTLDDFRKNVQLPPQLFSHNDQQAVWQSYQPEGGTVGWGGRVGDLMLSSNNTGKAAFTCVNVAGNAVYLAGDTVVPYAVAPDGPAPLLASRSSGLFGSSRASEVFQSLVTRQDHPVLLARTHAAIMKRAVAGQHTLSEALLTAPGNLPSMFTTSVDGKPRRLAQQLLMVARTIAARQALGLKRQVFFVSLGGFDLHDRLMLDHPRLMEQVAQALASFDEAMRSLGVDRQVTTFTASDFGRTLTSNGDGSDHGWGGHHLVMGGAVAGGRLYGTLPEPGLGGNDQVGQGRLLPSLSVDQLAAELGRWMGVSSSNLELVAPRYKRFGASELGGLFAATA